MAYSKEYAAKLIFTLDSVRKTQRAQRNIYDSGIVSPNQNTLASSLSAVASVLSLVFILGTPATLAAGVTSLVSGMIPDEKSVLQSLVYAGY